MQLNTVSLLNYHEGSHKCRYEERICMTRIPIQPFSVLLSISAQNINLWCELAAHIIT